jgi:hypothetical protein
MSAFLTYFYVYPWFGFLAVAGDVIHFSNSSYPLTEVFLFDAVDKVKFKKVLWPDLERKIQDFSTLMPL